MSDTKHTPGPWEVTYEVQAQGPVHCIREECGSLIARVSTWHYTRDNGEAIKEASANARVIAAAPDGYDANVAAFETRKQNADGTWSISDRAMKMIERAIAKATQP